MKFFGYAIFYLLKGGFNLGAYHKLFMVSSLGEKDPALRDSEIRKMWVG